MGAGPSGHKYRIIKIIRQLRTILRVASIKSGKFGRAKVQLHPLRKFLTP